MQAETRQVMARLTPGFTGFAAPVRALSGGQRQAIAIARAVHFNARILIMDEPTAALGVGEAGAVADLVRQLKAEGLGIFLISHDIHEVVALCDRVSVMKNGRLVGTVRVAEVSEDDILGMIILGKRPATRPSVGRSRTGRNRMYLGIDIGTSSVKTVLFDRDQRLIGQASQSLTRLAAASRLVRAGPRGLVARRRRHRRHARPRARPRRPARHRPLGPDARRGLPRPRRQGAAPGDPLERRPRHGGMRRDRGRLPARPRGRRQHRDAGLHRAEDRLAAQARAGGLRARSTRCSCPRTTSACG